MLIQVLCPFLIRLFFFFYCVLRFLFFLYTFFCPSLSLFSFGDSIYMYIRLTNIVSQLPDDCSFFFKSFLLFVLSFWIAVIDVSLKFTNIFFSISNLC